jgi:hypothetical protein
LGLVCFTFLKCGVFAAAFCFFAAAAVVTVTLLLLLLLLRPWNGVFLSQEYLSSVEAAESITAQLLAAYAAAGVVPLLESAVKSEDELRKAYSLLRAYEKAD